MFATPTPALDTLIGALDASGLHPLIVEDTSPQAPAPWRITLPLVCLHFDGLPTAALPPGDPDRALAELAGHGHSRAAAAAHLLTRLARLTYAVHATHLDPAAGTYHWRSLAWSGTALVVTGSGTARLEVREVLAA